jgi:hypothetical protein
LACQVGSSYLAGERKPTVPKFIRSNDAIQVQTE